MCRRYRGTLFFFNSGKDVHNCTRKCSRSSLRHLRLLISYERSQCTSTCLEFTPIFASIFFFCQWPGCRPWRVWCWPTWKEPTGICRPGQVFFGSKSTVIISARTMLNQQRFISFKRKNVLLVDMTPFSGWWYIPPLLDDMFVLNMWDWF